MKILVLTSTFPCWPNDIEPAFVQNPRNSLAQENPINVIASHFAGAPADAPAQHCRNVVLSPAETAKQGDLASAHFGEGNGGLLALAHQHRGQRAACQQPAGGLL